MNNREKIAHWIKILLILYALHSLAVALGLMFFPSEYFILFGFENCQFSFFKVQAGVFHLVMAVAYYLGSQKLDESHFLILFIISAKFIAFIFLILFYLLIEPVWTILVSGFGDGAMALLLYLFYSRYRQAKNG